MNQKLIDTIVHAVLYEGYILYPYRASAKKNRQRFTFGRVYPEAYSIAENNMEPCSMQTQCLIEGPTSAKLGSHRPLPPSHGPRYRRPGRPAAQTPSAR